MFRSYDFNSFFYFKKKIFFKKKSFLFHFIFSFYIFAPKNNNMITSNELNLLKKRIPKPRLLHINKQLRNLGYEETNLPKISRFFNAKWEKLDEKILEAALKAAEEHEHKMAKLKSKIKGDD